MRYRPVLAALAALVALVIRHRRLHTSRRPVPVGQPSGNPTDEGRWELLPYRSEIEAVHLALLRTGKVLYYSGFRKAEAVPTETRLWFPKTGEIKAPPTPADIFCAGHSFLPDGRLLSTGGTLEYRNLPPIPPFIVRLLRPITPTLSHLLAPLLGFKLTLTGPTFLYLFDPSTEQWAFAGDMPEGRWYPTNTTLPDGRVLILSGSNEGRGFGSGGEVKTNVRVEIYDSERGLEQVSTIPEMPGDHFFPPLYPRMHVLPLSEAERQAHPAGRVFCSGSGPQTKMLDLVTYEWTDVDTLRFGPRHDGSAVLLPLRPPDYRARVLTFGGTAGHGVEAEATETAEIIDLGEESPRWTWAESMSNGRLHSTAVILPDGRVLAAGGSGRGHFDDPVHDVEVFDPDEGKWRRVAPLLIPRGYHSTGILLPDGRVLVSGTTPLGKYELRMELYQPYYLFGGPRPTITYVDANLRYGQPFDLSYESERAVRSVVLIRPGAMTHAFDMDQRYVDLVFTPRGDGHLMVEAPPDAHVAPPGYYMLFLLSDEGVPSEAAFVHLPVGTESRP